MSTVIKCHLLQEMCQESFSQSPSTFTPTRNHQSRGLSAPSAYPRPLGTEVLYAGTDSRYCSECQHPRPGVEKDLFNQNFLPWAKKNRKSPAAFTRKEANSPTLHCHLQDLCSLGHRRPLPSLVDINLSLLGCVEKLCHSAFSGTKDAHPTQLVPSQPPPSESLSPLKPVQKERKR